VNASVHGRSIKVPVSQQSNLSSTSTETLFLSSKKKPDPLRIGSIRASRSPNGCIIKELGDGIISYLQRQCSGTTFKKARRYASNGLGSWRDILEKPKLKVGNYLKVIESMEI
jgi:hypothetical protein